MAAAAFDRCGLACLVDLFMAVFAKFMGGFLVAVDIGIAYIFCMTTGTLVNCHHFFLGMMAGCTGKHLLMITMRKDCRFSRCLSLQGQVRRANVYFHRIGTAGNEQGSDDEQDHPTCQA